ncbi:MAG TPA: AAA family ATPase, partial [Polyangiaceae bacterium]|nr:AAA family ATPase [Polyangiaceae bacterium]
MTSYPRPVSPLAATPSSAALLELRTYLSRLELERIACEGESDAPTEERFHGALLFVDVSGFTPITETLAKRGPRGAESLSEILNDYYGRLTALVDGYGGDVLFFAGDAAVALFRSDPGVLGDAVSLAAACGLEIRRALDGFATASAPGFRLSLRATVGAGAVRAMRVGVTPRLTLVTGAPVEQVARLGGLKARGIVVASGAHRLLGDWTASRRMSRDAFDVTALDPSRSKPATAGTVPEAALDAVEKALPRVVVQRTHAGQQAFLAEFRTVSVVFVGLQGGATLALAELHATVTALSDIVARFDGAVYQFLEDDKGTTLIVSFGVPPKTHEDDAARAALFAAAVAAELTSLGSESAIGVATGHLFCGAYGGARRKQYSLVGPTINRAARLMQAAREYGILCDEATRRAAERHAEFESLGSLVLKGLEEPVLVSRPSGDSPRSTRRRSSLPASIGRDDEREALTRAVRALSEGRSEGPIVLVADAGMGKSHMMGELRAISEEQGVKLVQGDADAMETGTPYYAFRSIFAELVGVRGLDPRAAQARVLDALSDSPELLPIAPLLSVVLPLDWAETPLTEQMTPQIRAENLTRLLVHLVEHAAEREPFLLLLEDGHWLDSASWAFVSLVRRLVSRVTAVVTMRPMDHEPPDCAKLKEGATRLGLPPMDREQTTELLVHRFGVPAVPRELVDFVVARAEGNPFYMGEIAYSLRDSGRLRTVDGRLEATAGWASLSALSFPDSLAAVIVSRIDRLAAAEQLALKVASVVGRHFEEAAVQDALPASEDRAGLPMVLARLQHLDLVARERDGAWIFRHAVTRETTYGLLSYSQRRSLHRAVAEHLERRHEHDLSPVYARLAQHFHLAEDSAKAATAYGKAGEQSLGVYANEEAIAFLGKALELDDGDPAT